ncbi:tubulin delta chain-like [Lineus longissimus]|uniref:tubulin delta chain-like n=1 Tax=Lineus longissimus TaxID=88925 RepID=UPI002B4D04B9
MSIVTIQVGQCGNQIGGQLFNTVMEDAHTSYPNVSKNIQRDYMQDTLETFFDVSPTKSEDDEVPKARAVMVDMEPKVISQTMQDAKKSGKWTYDPKQSFCQKRGSGNNWANGFCGHGPKARDSVMNLVRREVEKCDHFGGFLNLMSLAGGTGSGVGAYVTQCLRDEYPNSFIMNQVVWPYNTGEVIVQNYNAVLTLSHLYQSSDAILVMENDGIQKICSQLMNIKKISFRDMNRVISHQLASVLQPVQLYGGGRQLSNRLGRLLEHLVPHPEYKLLTLRNIPQMSEASIAYTVFQWHGMLKHLRQMLIANAAMEEGIDWHVRVNSAGGLAAHHNKSVSNLLVLRGKDINTTNIAPFREEKLYTSWVPKDSCLAVWQHDHPFHNYEKSAALLSNSQSPVVALDGIVGKAWQMFASRAYVHQYLKHGLAEEDFVDSFAGLEQVIRSYQAL